MPHLRLAILLAALLAAFPARAEDPKPRDQKIERKDGHRVWELTSYLRGTATEIRQTLIGQVEALLASRAKAKVRATDLTQKLDQARQHAENVLLADPQYKPLLTTLKDTERVKDEVRRNGSTAQERLDAGAAYVKAKAAFDQRHKQVVDDDANVVQLGKELAEARQQLREVEIAVGKEEVWRRELVDAIHGTFLIPWPMRRGMIGILGTITPRKAIGKDAFEGVYHAGEQVNTEGQREGIITIQQMIHPVRVIVRGVEPPWEVGKPIALNRAFAVGEPPPDEPTAPRRQQALVLQRTHDDIDELLEAVESGPAVPADEMEQMVRLAEQKEKPRRWGSVQPIIAALPPNLRPKPGERLTGDKRQKIDEWLSKEMVGDTVDLALTLQGIKLTDSGVEVFATTDAPGVNGRKHVFTLVCPESLRAKAEKVHAGQQARVTGTIKSVRLNPDTTVDLRIVDAAF